VAASILCTATHRPAQSLKEQVHNGREADVAKVQNGRLFHLDLLPSIECIVSAEIRLNQKLSSLWGEVGETVQHLSLI